MLLLINASGDLSVDHLVAGDKSVVAFQDFVLHEGIDTVSLAPFFGVLDAGLKSIGQCAMVGQMALVEGVEQGINYWFHIGWLVGYASRDWLRVEHHALLEHGRQQNNQIFCKIIYSLLLASSNAFRSSLCAQNGGSLPPRSHF